MQGLNITFMKVMHLSTNLRYVTFYYKVFNNVKKIALTALVTVVCLQKPLI